MSNEQAQIAQDLQEVEVSIDQAKKAVARHEALMRLTDNADFKMLITENFFRDEAERVVGARADASMKMNEIGMLMLEETMIGIGALRQYFLKIQKQGRDMKEALEQLQETQSELLVEQAGGGQIQ